MGVFADDIIKFYSNLKLVLKGSKDVQVMNPFVSEDVLHLCEWYHNKYYCDDGERYFLFGINPGRHGAGHTGVPFTDPIQIEAMGFANNWPKRHELSAKYIQDMIQAFGGLNLFANHFYISSVCPLGFVKQGKNINYYDEPQLISETKAFIIASIREQISIGARKDVAFSLGKGKNFKYLQQLNAEQGFFKRIIALPHPRWVMQYKLKMKDQIIDDTLNKLKSVLQ